MGKEFFADDVPDCCADSQGDAVNPELVVQQSKKGIAPDLGQPHQEGIGRFGGDQILLVKAQVQVKWI